MQTLRSCLIGIALSLVLAGLITGTLVRHLVQVLPILLALRLLSRSPGYLGAYATVSISGFWFVLVLLLWLYIAGVDGVPTGQYPRIVLVLSLIVGLFAWVGFTRGRRLGRPLEGRQRVATLAVFGVLQIVAVTLSFVGPAIFGSN